MDRSWRHRADPHANVPARPSPPRIFGMEWNQPTDRQIQFWQLDDGRPVVRIADGHERWIHDPCRPALGGPPGRRNCRLVEHYRRWRVGEPPRDERPHAARLL